MISCGVYPKGEVTGCRQLKFELEDQPEQPILDELDRGADFIAEALEEQDAQVFVHCF